MISALFVLLLLTTLNQCYASLMVKFLLPAPRAEYSLNTPIGVSWRVFNITTVSLYNLHFAVRSGSGQFLTKVEPVVPMVLGEGTLSPIETPGNYTLWIYAAARNQTTSLNGRFAKVSNLGWVYKCPFVIVDSWRTTNFAYSIETSYWFQFAMLLTSFCIF